MRPCQSHEGVGIKVEAVVAEQASDVGNTVMGMCVPPFSLHIRVLESPSGVECFSTPCVLRFKLLDKAVSEMSWSFLIRYIFSLTFQMLSTFLVHPYPKNPMSHLSFPNQFSPHFPGLSFLYTKASSLSSTRGRSHIWCVTS